MGDVIPFNKHSLLKLSHELTVRKDTDAERRSDNRFFMKILFKIADMIDAEKNKVKSRARGQMLQARGNEQNRTSVCGVSGQDSVGRRNS